MESILSEERWAKMIDDVRRVSEANNSKEEETTTVFEIIEESFSSRYRWKYKTNDT